MSSGCIVQWDQSNKNYILTRGVSGVDWRFYKHPLLEHVYDIYMKYWKDVDFVTCEGIRHTAEAGLISAVTHEIKEAHRCEGTHGQTCTIQKFKRLKRKAVSGIKLIWRE